jgi:hypothetical protein
MSNTKHEAYLVKTSGANFDYCEVAFLESLGATVDETEDGTIVTLDAGYDDDVEAFLDASEKVLSYQYGCTFLGVRETEYPNALAEAETFFGRLVFVRSPHDATYYELVDELAGKHIGMDLIWRS